MYWLCRSWGRRATGLPHRLGEGDGPDVHRVRDLVAQRHVERRHRPILVDHRRRCGGRHVGEPGRSGELPQKRRVRLNVDRPPGDPHTHGGRAGRVRSAGREIRLSRLPPDPHPLGRDAVEPRVLDRGDEATEIGKGELEPAPRCRPLLLPWEKIYFDHAARLSASPTDSISRGATSSTDTDSNTASRTLSRCTGLATSTGTLSRLPSASFSPGIRAPPPIVYTRPRPPAEREAVARNAAARSTPTAISSPRASTYGARSALCVRP